VDTATGKLLLYGGVNRLPAENVFLHDSWLWDGSNWMPVQGAGPSINHVVGTSDDNSGGIVVLGSTPQGFPETWKFANGSWTMLHPLLMPAVLDGAGFCFDHASKMSVHFGGTSDGDGLSNKTWLWDGAAWKLAHPPLSPSARNAAAMVCGPHLILTGGNTRAGKSSEVFTWDGATWRPIVSVHSPGARVAAGGGANGVGIFIVGGVSVDPAARGISVWDGTDWSDVR